MNDGQRQHQGQEREGQKPKPDTLPVAVTTPAKPAAVPPPPPSAFAAQVLGQPGKKRGLKGGPEVLDTARSTYLSREFSGQKDRRPKPGQKRKAEI